MDINQIMVKFWAEFGDGLIYRIKGTILGVRYLKLAFKSKITILDQKLNLI